MTMVALRRINWARLIKIFFSIAISVLGAGYFFETNIERLSGLDLVSIHMEPNLFYDESNIKGFWGHDSTISFDTSWEIYIRNEGNVVIEVKDMQVSEKEPYSDGVSITFSDRIKNQSGEKLKLPIAIEPGTSLVFRANITMKSAEVPDELAMWAYENGISVGNFERILEAEYDRTLFGGPLIFANEGERSYLAGAVPLGRLQIGTTRCNTFSSSNRLIGWAVQGYTKTELEHSCSRTAERVYSFREFLLNAWRLFAA